MQSADTMTPAEALLRLSGLEKPCTCWRVIDRNEGRTGTIRRAADPNCVFCAGTGKVPVLPGLREPCSACNGVTKPCYVDGLHEHVCDKCKGRPWLPKQGRDALYEAMEKAEWDYLVSQRGGVRCVRFFKVVNNNWAQGEDADDWRAAVRALLAAGYV